MRLQSRDICKLCVAEISLPKVRSFEDSCEKTFPRIAFLLLGLSPLEVCACEVGAPEVGVLEVGALELGALEVGAQCAKQWGLAMSGKKGTPPFSTEGLRAKRRSPEILI